MNQVTYLLGAGASAEVLPVVKKISERLKLLIQKISSHEFELTDVDEQFLRNGLELDKARKELIDDLKWLLQMNKSHSTIDTYAKKLFLQKSADYSRLKNVLSTFFVLVQLEGSPATEDEDHKMYDRRYDTFFASILQNKINGFPSNLKILSWNYDYQIERAYNEYVNRKFLIDVWKDLNVHQNIDNYSGEPHSDFEIFKLNGTAQTYRLKDKQHIAYTYILNEPFTKNSLAEVVNRYIEVKQLPNEYKSTLRFAWEDLTGLVMEAQAAANMSDVLVVVGYSFPYYNREIDKTIINQMLKLKKVYFQDPKPKVLLERFKSVRANMLNLETVLYEECDQFLLPDEL